MTTLRRQALRVLCTTDPNVKASSVRDVDPAVPVGADETLPEPPNLPGRPEKPELVPHVQLKQKSMATVEGRATLIHALAHIELNAIDLACDVCWRFPNMPDLFYQQWWNVACEEALHFQLLRGHLATLGYSYGDFPAHNALWLLADRTKHDLLARIALVPRTAEARGLDASLPMKKKLVGAGDLKAGEILDVILRDEIGHVRVGNHWFRWLCAERSLDPIQTYAELAERYQAPKVRGPFNMEARRAAGFEESELDVLLG